MRHLSRHLRHTTIIASKGQWNSFGHKLNLSQRATRPNCITSLSLSNFRNTSKLISHKPSINNKIELLRPLIHPWYTWKSSGLTNTTWARANMLRVFLWSSPAWKNQITSLVWNISSALTIFAVIDGGDSLRIEPLLSRWEHVALMGLVN